MNKSGYIVQIKNEYFFLNNITQDASKAYSYKLEELADTDWVKRYDPKYDNPHYCSEVNKLDYFYSVN